MYSMLLLTSTEHYKIYLMAQNKEEQKGKKKTRKMGRRGKKCYIKEGEKEWEED